VEELRTGLWRWTTRHPEWVANANPGSAADWPPDVGSVAFAGPDALVLIDPLVPDGLWPKLDELAERNARVHVLTTIGWHRRSRDAVVARYGAETSRAKANLPAGVESLPIKRAGETMFFLPEHCALVPGDRILGDDSGGLRLCPESWLRYLSSGMSQGELRDALRPLLELPIDHVLASHGEPVLKGGGSALRRALEA
jgi:hypothetical protein